MLLTPQQRAAFNSVIANRAWMRRSGYTWSGHRLWSEDEVGAVRQFYPDYRLLVRALPSRTRKAIELKAAKLGIARPRRIWTNSEVRVMRPPYIAGVPIADILSLLDNKAKRQVYGKAWRERIRRPRKRPKVLGHRVLDAIRQRAFDLNLSLCELEEETGQGTLGSAKRIRWDALERAAGFLGGTLMIRWPGEA